MSRDISILDSPWPSVTFSTNRSKLPARARLVAQQGPPGVDTRSPLRERDLPCWLLCVGRDDRLHLSAEFAALRGPTSNSQDLLAFVLFCMMPEGAL
jgi:hypothetical protein